MSLATPPHPVNTPRPGFDPRISALIVLTALNAANHLDRQLTSILLEPIRQDFGLDDIQLGLLSGPVFAVLYTLLGLPIAAWVSQRGRVNVIAAFAGLWGAATAISGFAQSFGQLLLGRLGVGVGEAGLAPVAQALISDLYSPGRRSTAMSIFTAGLNAGVFVAFLVGGVAGQTYGWRKTFVVAGIATVFLGLLMKIAVTGIDRHAVPSASRSSLPIGIAAMWRRAWRDPVLRHVCAGATLTSTVSYAAGAWLPSFLIRAHGFQLASAGLFLALIIGIGGFFGTWVGGLVSDRLRSRDVRWSLWCLAAAFLATKPLSVGFYLVGHTPLALSLSILPAMVGAIFVGPSVAAIHDRVEPGLRPLASAVFSVLVNLVGLGLGPLLVGLMSERLFVAAGPNALGYALATIQVLGVWGALHYGIAGQCLVDGRYGPASRARERVR